MISKFPTFHCLVSFFCRWRSASEQTFATRPFAFWGGTASSRESIAENRELQGNRIIFHENGNLYPDLSAVRRSSLDYVDKPVDDFSVRFDAASATPVDNVLGCTACGDNAQEIVNNCAAWQISTVGVEPIDYSYSMTIGELYINSRYDIGKIRIEYDCEILDLDFLRSRAV